MTMTMQLVLITLLSVLTLAPWLQQLANLRPGTVWLALLIDLGLIGLVVSQHFGVWGLLYIALTAYKLLNYARLLYGRMQPRHLASVTWRTAFFLTLAQIGLGIAAYRLSAWSPIAAYLLVLGQVLLNGSFLLSTARHLRTTKTLQATKAYTDASLPSISVLIPARNETEDLQACLQALIASNYPKLEIIVLDDCSQNRHTSEIIRSFAHDGVRFVAGDVPGDNWLAKNFAYQQLAEAANGEYVVFCGADLQMSPGALRELVTTMLEKQKTMLSVLPQNAHPSNALTYLIQPMRYAWELSLPRRFFNRPAVLSTCWIIKKDVLLAAGSFKAVSRTITPESHFARFTARGDGYSFLRSNLLVSNKPVDQQKFTTVRVRYPQLHRRPEMVALVTFVELLAIVLPLPTAIIAVIAGAWLVAIPASIAFLISYVVYLQITGIMYGRSIISGVLLAPLSAAYDLFLLHVSMYRYEFREVIWKGRNICLPIMRFDEPAATTPQPNRVSK